MEKYKYGLAYDGAVKDVERLQKEVNYLYNIVSGKRAFIPFSEISSHPLTRLGISPSSTEQVANRWFLKPAELSKRYPELAKVESNQSDTTTSSSEVDVEGANTAVEELGIGSKVSPSNDVKPSDFNKTSLMLKKDRVAVNPSTEKAIQTYFGKEVTKKDRNLDQLGFKWLKPAKGTKEILDKSILGQNLSERF